MSTSEVQKSLFDLFLESELKLSPKPPGSPPLPNLKFDHGAMVLNREDTERFLAWICCRGESILAQIIVRNAFQRLEHGTDCIVDDNLCVENGLLTVRLFNGFCVVRPTGWTQTGDDPANRRPAMDWLHVEWAVTAEPTADNACRPDKYQSVAKTNLDSVLRNMRAEALGQSRGGHEFDDFCHKWTCRLDDAAKPLTDRVRTVYLHLLIHGSDDRPDAIEKAVCEVLGGDPINGVAIKDFVRDADDSETEEAIQFARFGVSQWVQDQVTYVPNGPPSV